jgi:predicted ATPase/signal transduction histidine kinase/tRNA A-37 threonylcarbamoyl transferase component Bud32
VVLKVLDPKRSRPRDVDQLRHEYEIGQSLKGLGIVEPLALSTYQGLPALELEAFAGESLDRLVGQPMPIAGFLALASRIASIVAGIHERGLIHKDLKPHNILFDRRTGEVRIADFCIALRMAREQTTVRPARLIEGSLPYVSPEQTGRMNRSIDSRSDLYTLGVTFYELLTGRLPFQAQDAIGWVHCHVARQPPPPVVFRPSVPGAVSDIILRLLAKVPDDRYQSASGLAHDLQRCVDQWRESGQITRFRLGERDVSDRFLIPQKLYGRANESRLLHEAFERVVTTGRPELFLVSGSSGIGKSSVVYELHRPIVVARGLFAPGKFEQYRRDVPYFTVVQAFREVMLDILAESPESIAAWRAEITAALGSNGRLVVDLIPQVGLVIGPQPTVPELSFGEAENRLRLVLRAFVTALASPAHPLVLFLDDLQWADPASLKLLGDLIVAHGPRHLLLIGAFRDNEVGPQHPLRRAVDEASAQGGSIRRLVLGPLAGADVDELVADAVHASTSEAAPLARLVREKTGGNPFFVIQFLTTLHRKGMIAFDHGAGRWRWDLARIRAQGYTDNVAELMLAKLSELPAATRAALELAACLGASMDEDTIGLVFGRDPHRALRAAVEEDLLLQLDGTYRFSHDRVQEAAYALIPAGDRARVHLRVGRRLWHRTAPVENDDRIFDVVDQLNQGAALITSRGERERVAALNLMAGRRAQRSTAYASALRYLAAGAALLDESSWERRYELAFAFDLHRAECEFLTGDLEAAERRLATLANRAVGLVDALAVARVQAELYLALSDVRRALEACLGCLRRIGIAWPLHPTDEEVRQEVARMWRQLGDRPIEALIDLPMTDPVWRAAVDVLSTGTAAANFIDENLSFLFTARTVTLSLEHGNSDGSPLAYVLLGKLLGPYFDDYDAAFRFGKVGVALVDERGLVRFKAAVISCFGIMVSPWSQHARVGVELQRRAFEAAQQTGEVQYGSYTRNAAVSLLLLTGEPLQEVEACAQDGLAFVRKTRFAQTEDVLVAQIRLIRQLRGLTPSLSSFDGDGFEEQTHERHMEGDPIHLIGSCWYWIRKLQGRYLADEYGAALEAAARARAILWITNAFPESAEYHFYAGLARGAAHDAASAEAQAEHRAALAEHHRKLLLWSRACPANFENRAALLGAEVARLRGDGDEAIRLYEQAIRSARDSGFVHNEAIAYEVAARFYRSRGLSLIADTYLREARDRYLRWGADGKVRDLERRRPHLVEPRPSSATATLALEAEHLDLLSVVKASQTISGVMVRERLIETLLQLVLEAGGARRAVLLGGEGREGVAAEVRSEPAAPAERPVPGTDLPDAVLGYVRRTRERVLLDDAASDAGRFSGDEYLTRARPRSVLCLPIRRQAELVALLYLENDLVPGAFTPERLLALELLASQTAISLENSRLLEREQARRVDAEAAEQRALLLSEATAVMTSSADSDGLFSALTQVCVRRFADWAIIDLIDGQRTTRIAGAHREERMESLLRELSERYPGGVSSPAPASTVLKSGRPVLLPYVDDDDIRARMVDQHHADLIRALGTRSAMVVPLVAREAQLGALTLASSSPGRFGPADLDLAVEIGRRAALAIDNARLLRETQQAVRLRDEFLAVASHELRTPVTSLMISVDRLLRSEGKQRLPPQAVSTSLHRVKHSAERLQRLTNELLDVTRIEHECLDLTPEEVDLGALAGQVVEELRLDLGAAGCVVHLDAAPVRGLWDRARLEQVITNLLSNALKFGSGRPIEVCVRSAGGGAQLSVRDHGIGIEPDRQPFIFDRFERAVPTAHYGGLGLGLYIARRLVQAQGGELRVESVPGQGATFTVTLPPVAPSAPAAPSGDV